MAKARLSKGTAVTQDDFDAIKKLLNAGVSIRQTSKVVQRAESTVNQIAKANDLQHYIELCRAYRVPKEKKQTTVQASVQPPTGQQSNDYKAHTSILILADAINRLADILETDTPIEKEAKEYKLFGRR